MNATELIFQRLIQTLDAQQQNAENLAQSLQQVAACLFHSFLNDGKTLLVAPNASRHLAQYWVQLLAQGGERERMGLPALTLDAQAAEQAVYTYGRPNDVLVVIVPPNGTVDVAVWHAAREQAMQIVFIGANVPDHAADITLILPATHHTDFHEHLLALCHSLCAALDAALLDGTPL